MINLLVTGLYVLNAHKYTRVAISSLAIVTAVLLPAHVEVELALLQLHRPVPLQITTTTTQTHG